jgi:CRP/FNR family transcriptional regulator, cyclic AMP receptor protein
MRPRALGEYVRLLDVDPELGDLLRAERRELAAEELVVEVRRARVGAWPEPLIGDRPDEPGLLILGGVLSLEVGLEERASLELLGPGDLVRPPAQLEHALLPVATAALVRSPLTFAVLDGKFAVKASRYPEIVAALVARLAERSERLATTQAVAQITGVDRRLKALFWHLAERWGRMTPHGIVVYLALSHSLLAQIVGARRPTVTTALAVLAERGELHRRPDGSWLLVGDPPLRRAA